MAGWYSFVMREKFNLSVYFVLDPACCNDRDVAEVAAAALRGGVTMIQFRDKDRSVVDVKPDAARVLKLCRDAGVPFLVNDHVDLAAEIGADGVHIGQGDMRASSAREVLGRDKIIGLTAFTPDHMEAIDPDVVDYAGTGPVYPTKTDKGKPVIGPDGLAELIKLCPVPVVGIGGITPENAAAVLKTGAQGVAMMRAISAADDPALAAREFISIVKK